MTRYESSVILDKLDTIERELRMLHPFRADAYTLEILFQRFSKHLWQASAEGNMTAFNCARCGALLTKNGPLGYIYDDSHLKTTTPCGSTTT